MSIPHPKRRIAIIGAGVSGISAIKCCKEEEQLFSEIICFERTAHPGGLWMYREFEDEINVTSNSNITRNNNNIEKYDQTVTRNRTTVDKVKSNVTTVMKGTIANSSKEMSAFSDFPPNSLAPNFMHHQEMLKYIIEYAEYFDCLKHIRYNVEVIKVAQFGSKMSIVLKDHSNDAVGAINELFDIVLVASGHHGRPFRPTFAGQSDFQGEIIHTHNYKKPDKFTDENILIVGVGNSGLDVAVEVSNVAREVYLSTRSGTWVLPRLGFRGGRPFDTNFLTRFMHLFKENFSPSVVSFVIETFLNRRFDHQLFGLRPDHPLFHEHPTINDQIATKIICGMVKVRGDIEFITQSGVVFKEAGTNDNSNDGSKRKVTQVDSIILATGYEVDYPFLSPDLRSQIVSGSGFNVYKYVFPILSSDESDAGDTCHNVKLAFIGLPNALGPLFPIVEAQSRWVVQVIKGTCKLPPKSVMKKHLEIQEMTRKKKFTNRLRHIVQVEWIPYLDEIASEFGAKMDMGQLFRSDFKLWTKLYFGPCVPYQYRLTGPHSWPGARDAILKVNERMESPFRASARTTESTGKLDQVSNNPRYWDHGIIFTFFFGVIVVTLLDMMNMFF